MAAAPGLLEFADKTKKVCPNTEYCINYGIYTDRILRLFDHFRDLRYVTEITAIGNPSGNGYVRRLKFKRDFEGIKYEAVALMKYPTLELDTNLYGTPETPERTPNNPNYLYNVTDMFDFLIAAKQEPAPNVFENDFPGNLQLYGTFDIHLTTNNLVATSYVAIPETTRYISSNFHSTYNLPGVV